MKSNNSYPKLPEIIKSRPKSFSEGYGVINQFPEYNQIKKEDDKSIPILEKEEVSIPNSNNKDYIEIIYNKIVGFTFHLVLIATFELIFFNYYIIQYENNAVISLSTQLVQPIINSCSNLSNTSKVIVDGFINVFINETTINNNANSDKNVREINNSIINKLSLYYYAGVFSWFIFILLINLKIKRKIDYTMIFIDNLIMIVILGSYEYLFFHNIIFKYLTLGPNELIKNIMVNLLTAC
jgi:hypothetical protein